MGEYAENAFDPNPFPIKETTWQMYCPLSIKKAHCPSLQR